MPLCTALQQRERLGLPGEQLIGHPLERLADHHRLAAVRVPGAEVDIGQVAGAPAVAPLGAEHHEVQGVHRLDLQPGPAPPAGRVRRVQRLDHDALVPCLQGAVEQVGRLLRRGSQRARHPVRARGPVERVQPGHERLVDQVGAVEVQAVEEVRPLGAGAEAAHGVLEQQRPAVNVDRQRLAVQHHALAGQPQGQLDQLGHGGGDVAQAAGEHRDPLAGPMQLDPGAV